MSKRKSLGTVNAVLGYVSPQYHAEVVGNLSSRAAAIAAILTHATTRLRPVDLRDAQILARGRPARELKRALRRWSKT